MAEPIVTRERIAEQANQAALLYARTHLPQQNPYPVNSDAAQAWKASFERFLVLHTAPTAEASA